jgi:YegS/Rv2252/BmrU family lipid kinase
VDAVSVSLERQAGWGGREEKLHAIVNPAAGNGRGTRHWPKVAHALVEAGIAFDTYFTHGPGDATRMAKGLAEQGVGTILAVGGDGTVNEIINGMLTGEGPISPATRLAIVPCGTGKDLARTLGTRTVEALIAAIDAGETARIDVGRIEYIAAGGEPEARYFANVADMGLGAETAERINRSSKALGGLITYMKGAVQTIASFEARPARVTVDGVEIYDGNAHMVIFANGRFFAGGMRIAPLASIQDGEFDIFVLEDVGKPALLGSLLPRVYFGRHVEANGVIHLRGRAAQVESESMLVEMDGEQPGRAPASIQIAHQCLNVLVADGHLADHRQPPGSE